MTAFLQTTQNQGQKPCQGDALKLAYQILDTAYTLCLEAGDLNCPGEVRQMVMRSKMYIGRQYTEWLKGGM